MNAKGNFTKARTALGLVLVALLALATSATPAAAQGAISFLQPLDTPLVSMTDGSGPVGLAAGDFEGDGIVDLAVTLLEAVPTGGQQGFVAVMRGRGDGTFEALITLLTLPLNVFARGILAKDFDRDGTLDLVVAVGESRQILFFKGHGDGTFDAPVATSTTHRPQGVQTADLNGDGFLDLVTLNPEDNTVSVLLGVGNGTFHAPTNYAVGSNPLDVAIGDVDGISGPDLVVGNNGSATVSVLLNNGHGTFGTATNFNARVKPQGLYLADFDGDGKLDVVAAGNDWVSPPPTIAANGCMVFMKGQGNGTFAAVGSELHRARFDTHSPIHRERRPRLERRRQSGCAVCPLAIGRIREKHRRCRVERRRRNGDVPHELLGGRAGAADGERKSGFRARSGCRRG